MLILLKKYAYTIYFEIVNIIYVYFMLFFS